MQLSTSTLSVRSASQADEPAVPGIDTLPAPALDTHRAREEAIAAMLEALQCVDNSGAFSCNCGRTPCEGTCISTLVEVALQKAKSMEQPAIATAGPTSPVIPIRYTFTRRNGFKVENIATVTITPIDPDQQTDCLDQFKKALTDWASETDEGRQTWKSSYGNFNVGFLATHAPGDNLAPYLRRRGLANYSVLMANDEIIVEQAHDEVLINVNDLTP